MLNPTNKDIFEIYEWLHGEWVMFTEPNAKLGYLNAIADIIQLLINEQKGEK